MRIFLDANILFSAAAAQSATSRLINAVISHAEAITNPHAIEEAHRNLLLKRPDQIPGLHALLKNITVSGSFQNLLSYPVPTNDIPIISGAVASKCTHLLTSDKKHFGKWYGKKLHGVTVVSSTMLSDLLPTIKR